MRKTSALVLAFSIAVFTQYSISDAKIIPIISLLLFDEANANTQKALVNARIYTVNNAQPWAQALLIEDGKIVNIGTTDQILNAAKSDAQVTDLNGKLVLPGFQDPHLHVAEAGFNELLCFLSEDNSFAGYRDELRECARQQQDLPWVLGAGVYVAGLLNRGQLPIDFLDGLFPDKPVLILDDLGHGAWANSAAMREAGYLPFQSQPQGGIVHIDPDSNRASGIVFENAQQSLRSAAINAVDPDLSLAYDGLLGALSELAKNGITTVSDAGGYWTRGDHLIWQRAEDQGQLTVRASNALYVFPDRDVDEQIDVLKQIYSNDANKLVRFNQVKIYIDGILSLGTSALYQPYDFIPIAELGFDKGFEYFNPAELNRYVFELEAAGFQMHFHTTGDRGAGIALNAVEAARQQNQITDLRHRITHLFLTTAPDRQRFSGLGMIADFQLNPSALSQDYLNFITDIVGSRSAQLFAIRSFLDNGTKTVLSSDWDAGPLPVLGTIKRALTRNTQAVPDLATAIRMTTLDVAYLLHHENKTGSIEVGKYADLVVLDKNIFELPVSQVDQANVISTLLEGEVIYDSQQLFD